METNCEKLRQTCRRNLTEKTLNSSTVLCGQPKARTHTMHVSFSSCLVERLPALCRRQAKPDRLTTWFTITEASTVASVYEFLASLVSFVTLNTMTCHLLSCDQPCESQLKGEQHNGV